MRWWRCFAETPPAIPSGAFGLLLLNNEPLAVMPEPLLPDWAVNVHEPPAGLYWKVLTFGVSKPKLKTNCGVALTSNELPLSAPAVFAETT